MISHGFFRGSLARLPMRMLLSSSASPINKSRASRSRFIGRLSRNLCIRWISCCLQARDVSLMACVKRSEGASSRGYSLSCDRKYAPCVSPGQWQSNHTYRIRTCDRRRSSGHTVYMQRTCTTKDFSLPFTALKPDRCLFDDCISQRHSMSCIIRGSCTSIVTFTSALAHIISLAMVHTHSWLFNEWGF